MMHNPQCSYGCGNIAVYLLQFKNQSKWCCSNTFFKCPNYINRISVWKGRKHTEEQKKKIGKSKIGKPLSIEHKQLLSKIKKGKYIGKDNPFYGKSHSQEKKKKQSEYMKNGGAIKAGSIKGKIILDETRKKISISLKGKKMSEEFKNKCKIRALSGSAAYASSCNKNPSKPQVKLYSMIKQLFESAILNYPIKHLNFVLDIVIPEHKINIEYDGIYWHQDKTKDLQRQKKLEEEGWKFIRYNGGPKDILPSIEQVKKDIENIMKG